MDNVLIIGNGGREHALGWNIAQHPEVATVYYAPGNGGTAHEHKGKNLDVNPLDFEALKKIVNEKRIRLVVVGPEEPLSLGITDALYGHVSILGPHSIEARVIETNKYYSYELMQTLGIPQALAQHCSSLEEAKQAIQNHPTEDLVIKACGLKAGKGVGVFDTKREALEDLLKHPEKYGEEVLIAERLYGEECSVFGISNGEKITMIPALFQDHKRLGDGDQGPNTGGMGAYGPVIHLDQNILRYAEEKLMQPLIEHVALHGRPYKGFLYAGLIITKEGPKVLEYNVRFGDPECQPAMMLMHESIYPHLLAAAQGNDIPAIKLKPGTATCIVLAAPGYPEQPIKNLPINGIPEAEHQPNTKVFHAGTKAVDPLSGAPFTSTGGRILGVTSYAETLETSINQAYQAVRCIHSLEGLSFNYRKDIGNKALRK